MGINIPTALGYAVARRGLLANQIAMNVINHNIANANTEGYSRQRADIAQMDPLNPATMSNNVAYGQIGQGVYVEGISRSHDNFLDSQVREQGNLAAYQQTLQDVFAQMEDVLAEPSESGISTIINNFFNAAQTLSINPDDGALRTNFLESAKTMLNAFKEQATQLQDLRTYIVGDPSLPGSAASSQAALNVTEINNALRDIASLNNQIVTVVASGGAPNDLLDKRDVLLDQLSQKVNIEIDYKANEQIDIRIGSNYLLRSKQVVDTLSAVQNTNAATQTNTPLLIQLTSAGTDITNNITGGELGGALFMGGNAAGKTTIRGLMEKLDTLFTQIATEINSLQASGMDLNGTVHASPDPNGNIFTLAAGSGLSLFRYAVNSAIVNDPRLIAAAQDGGVAGFPGVGDGRNMLKMAQVGNKALAGLGSLTPKEYFTATVSILGTESKSAKDTAENLSLVVTQLEQRRQSLQGVNLEEEMVDLMKFQRGFEASSRVLRAMDDVLDTLINRLT